MIYKKLIGLIRIIIKLVHAIWAINWFKFMRLYKTDAEIVVLFSIIKFYDVIFEPFIWDLGYIKSLIENNKQFHIIFRKKNISVQNKIVLWSPWKKWDPWIFSNYTNTLVHIAEQLKIQNNKVFPDDYEICYLENKSYMYDKFEEFGIRHPKTAIIQHPEDIKTLNIKYPFLIKGEHSCGSKDIIKINSEAEYYKFFKENDYFRTNENIIIQKLLNIHRDLRVTIVDDEIVLYFWRVNTKEEWRPTATKYGAKVVFGKFPSDWKKYIINNFKKLKLNMGAFDIAWENDDLSTEPYFLEVSPRFSPNPVVDLSVKKFEYGEYKRKLLLKKSFGVEQNKIIFNITNKYICMIFRKLVNSQ